jgi:transcription elongation factor GreA
MTLKQTPITKEGLAKLEEELEHLRTVRRSEVAKRIQEAKELASPQNNPEYEDAKNEQAFVEGRILTIEQIIQNSVLIDEDEAHHSNVVQIGSTVTVKKDNGEKDNYTIVGSAEADPKEGRISNESPVGQALLGKRVGEKVEVKVPAGVLRYTIASIS